MIRVNQTRWTLLNERAERLKAGGGISLILAVGLVSAAATIVAIELQTGLQIYGEVSLSMISLYFAVVALILQFKARSITDELALIEDEYDLRVNHEDFL